MTVFDIEMLNVNAGMLYVNNGDILCEFLRSLTDRDLTDSQTPAGQQPM